MAATVFVLDIVATLALSGVLLYSYGDWMRQRLFVTLSVWIAWYFSFLIIFVLPLDVSSTAYRQCLNVSAVTLAPTEPATTVHSVITEQDIKKTRLAGQPAEPAAGAAEKVVFADFCGEPYSLLDESVLPGLWRVVYWSSQLLTWLVLPVMQSFSQSGEFTVWGKLKGAAWDNAVYYASYLLIAVTLLVYIATKPDLDLDWEKLKAIAASASNTWGLAVLVLMLGYGLVEVPRNCWNRSQRGYQLTRAYFRIAKLMSEKTDAEEALDDVLATLRAISGLVDANDPRRPMVDTILVKVPHETMERIGRRRGIGPDLGHNPPTEKTLVRLHRQVIRSLQNQKRTEAQWNDWTDAVFELEDINKNMVSNDHRFVHTLSRPPRSLLARTVYGPAVEWYWKCLVSPLLLRFAAVVACAMSVLVVWSEATFFSLNPTLSVFAAVIDGLATNYAAIEFVCLATIFYLCLCAYYTIFKVRVLDYYYLAGNHHSDEYTLLFSGALLCRLTPPLCLNFLSLIHMDSHVVNRRGSGPEEETAYTAIMGHMDVVSLVSDYFNVYFPMALLALAAATYFSLGARLMSALGFQQFLAQDSDVTLDIVDEGKEHVKREKRRRQRLAESASRRRDFASRFGDVEARDPRRRSSDIVKSYARNGDSSPERSLLPSQHNQQMTSSSLAEQMNSPAKSCNMTETIDLCSPTHRMGAGEPPRNIFDDI